MTAQHEERPNESFMIEIRGVDKASNLINKEFQGNFPLMAAHLKVMNKRMVLLNPVRYSLARKHIELYSVL
jgi:hypothetical protein